MNVLKACIIGALVAAMLLVAPAIAAINTIPRGSTVFIGEEGLDIRPAGVSTGSTIAWWSDSSSITTGVPSASVSVDDASNFYIAPVTFSGKAGPWYTFPARQLAFYVNDPSLDIRIIDDSSDFEVVGTVRWVPKGDSVSFRIENNLFQMTKRSGVSGAPVTIYVRSPDGAEFSQLSGNNLINIPVNTNTYSTGPIWSTGSYTSGTYTIWADCNANGMNDNYNVAGKTRSPDKSMLLQSVNPLITSSVTPTTKTPAFTVIPTEIATSVPTTVPSPPVTTITIPVGTSPVTIPPETQAIPAPLPTTIPGSGFMMVVAAISAALILITGKRNS
jgi:hypothetical protein